MAAVGRDTAAGRYAAAPPDKKEGALMSELDLLALADGNHDFSELRGTETVKKKMKDIIHAVLGPKKDTLTFKELLDTFSKIGTHNTKVDFTEGDIMKEHTALSGLTGIPHADYTSNPGGIHLTKDIFGREYAIDSVLVIENGEFKQTSKDYFDKFLVPGTMDDTTFYFMIDALNVKFHHIFSPEEQAKFGGRDDGKGRRAVYLECREGTNDSTGKPDLSFLVDPTADKLIKVVVERDEKQTDIVYPAYKPGMKDYHYLFDSTFSVSVDYNKNIPDGIKHTTTTFHNTHFTTTVEVNKGKKEDHPSAVNSLFPRLVNLFKVAFGQQAIKIGVREQYYSLLQQKRAGDWLQVLSSLDTTRYRGIPADSDIFLCTHDFLCAAYGLAVGANIILTLYDDRNKRGWTVRFNRIKRGAAREAAIHAIQAANRMKLEADIRTGPDLTQILYGKDDKTINDVIDIYMSEREAKYRSIIEGIGRVGTAFEDYVKSVTQVDPRGVPPNRWKDTIKEPLEAHIREILRMYLHLSTFCSYVHVIRKVDLRGYTAIKNGRDITAANYEAIFQVHTALQNMRAILDSAIEGGATGGGQPRGGDTIQGAIRYTMNKFFTGGAEDQAIHASQKSREQLVKDLRIFNKIFQPSNTKINAVGLFQFISQIPDPAVLNTLHSTVYAELVKIAKVYISVAKDINTFLETMTVLIHTGMGVAPVVILPDSDNKQEEILQSMYRLDSGGIVKRRGGLPPAAAEPSVAGTRRRRELQTIAEGDEEGGEEQSAKKGKGASASQLGGGDEDRQVYQCTMFTPGLRILKAKGSAFLSHPRHIGDEAAFLEHAIDFHAPYMVGGRTQRRSGHRRLTSSARTAYTSKKMVPGQFDLHPLTYLFFYVRETLFQLEAGREENMATQLRFAQLFMLWKTVSNTLMKKYPPGKYPFFIRAVYRVLIHLLLGVLPNALEAKQGTHASKFIDALKLSKAEIAEFTSSINDGYFGTPFFKEYEKHVAEVSLERIILAAVVDSMGKRTPVTDTATTRAKYISELAHFQKDIVRYLGDILSNEQAGLHPLSHIRFALPSTRHKAKAITSLKNGYSRVTIRAKSPSKISKRHMVASHTRKMGSHMRGRSAEPPFLMGMGGGDRR